MHNLQTRKNLLPIGDFHFPREMMEELVTLSRNDKSNNTIGIKVISGGHATWFELSSQGSNYD